MPEVGHGLEKISRIPVFVCSPSPEWKSYLKNLEKRNVEGLVGGRTISNEYL